MSVNIRVSQIKTNDVKIDLGHFKTKILKCRDYNIIVSKLWILSLKICGVIQRKMLKNQS